ncbi:MAG: FAD-dependent oxidoreductase [Pseudomonadota bacterium]
MTRIAVVGGGYAGISCLAAVRSQLPAAHLTLIDPSAHHLKLTHLHEAASRPLDELRIPFAELADRLRFEHVRGWLGESDQGFDVGDLAQWSAARRFPVRLAGDAQAVQRFDADYLVLACGGEPTLEAAGWPKVLTLRELRDLDLRQRLRDLCDEHGVDVRVSVVGAGASGVQFACELAEAVRRLGARGTVRLLDQAHAPLSEMPERVRRYALERLTAVGVEWWPQAQFEGQEGDVLRFRRGDRDGAIDEVPSNLTLLLTGVKPSPCSMKTNRYGQVQIEGRALEAVFAAGDCAQVDGGGSNAATAQVALRQGRHVGINLARLHRRRPLLEWVFQELGYVVSLGVLDAAGWVLFRGHVVTGMAAVGIKGAVDTQYDLFLEGIDTYLL